MNTVYVLDIGELAPYRERALPLLSGERQRKVLSAHSEINALRSLGAGLLLRHYIGEGPFSYGEFGKPYLPGGPPFSLSHGGELVVLAVGEQGTELGVDVERTDRSWRGAVARRLFTQEEQRWLNGSSERFFRLWTRKEAVLKCRGSGFSRLAVFSVMDDCCSVDGVDYRLNTLAAKEHCISLAVRGGAETVSICMINVQILLDLFG